LDLLTVQNDLYNYQSSAIIAAYDERIAKGRMLAAIGKLAAAYYGEQKDSSLNAGAGAGASTNDVMPQTSGSLLRAQPQSVKPSAP
jgi:hypothetical protein